MMATTETNPKANPFWRTPDSTMQKKLTELTRDEKGEVVSFEGGQMLNKRLEGMGIRRGKIISRISSQIMRGPVIVSVDGRQTAVGRGIASKVLVKPVNGDHSAGRPEQNS